MSSGTVTKEFPNPPEVISAAPMSTPGGEGSAPSTTTGTGNVVNSPNGLESIVAPPASGGGLDTVGSSQMGVGSFFNTAKNAIQQMSKLPGEQNAGQGNTEAESRAQMGYEEPLSGGVNSVFGGPAPTDIPAYMKDWFPNYNEINGTTPQMSTPVPGEFTPIGGEVTGNATGSILSDAGSAVGSMMPYMAAIGAAKALGKITQQLAPGGGTDSDMSYQARIGRIASHADEGIFKPLMEEVNAPQPLIDFSTYSNPGGMFLSWAGEGLGKILQGLGGGSHSPDAADVQEWKDYYQPVMTAVWDYAKANDMPLPTGSEYQTLVSPQRYHPPLENYISQAIDAYALQNNPGHAPPSFLKAMGWQGHQDWADNYWNEFGPGSYGGGGDTGGA